MRTACAASRCSSGLRSVPNRFWIFIYERMSWPFLWPYEQIPFETAAVLAGTFLFLFRRRRIPHWAIWIVLAAHYLFWYFAPSYSSPSLLTYAGPTGPV